MSKTFFSLQSQTCNFFITNFDLIDLKFGKVFDCQKTNKQTFKKTCIVFLSSDLASSSICYLSQLLHLEWNLNQRFLDNNLSPFVTNFLSNNHTKKIESSLSKKNHFRFLDNNLNSIFLHKCVNAKITMDNNYLVQVSSNNWKNSNSILFDFTADFKINQNSRIQIEFNKFFFAALMSTFPRISHKIN